MLQNFTAYHSHSVQTHRPSLPPSLPSPPSFFLPLGSGRSLLPVGTADNKHPNPRPSCTLGQGNSIQTHLHGLPWQQGPSVRQTRWLKEPVLSKCERINTHTHSQLPGGPGSRVKEPHFLSRQTRAKHPSSHFHSFPFFLVSPAPPFSRGFSLSELDIHCTAFFVCVPDCDWCSVCNGSLGLAALAHPSDY